MLEVLEKILVYKTGPRIAVDAFFLRNRVITQLPYSVLILRGFRRIRKSGIFHLEKMLFSQTVTFFFKEYHVINYGEHVTVLLSISKISTLLKALLLV